MSGTTTADTPKPAIIQASTTNDIIVAAANDPQIKAAIVQAFGAQLAQAQKSPLGMVIGAAIGFFGTRYGVTVDPGVLAVATGVLAILGGDLWQWAAGKWWPTTTKGTTP